jgi:predicted nucleotidyltransferase
MTESVATLFSTFPQVKAIALSGSEGAGEADPLSDIDLYVYTDLEVPTAERRAIAGHFASRMEIDNRFWNPAMSGSSGPPAVASTSCIAAPRG